MELEQLTFQSLTGFLSSIAGMAVYMYMFCPNRRCCHTSEVRELLECKEKVKCLEFEKGSR